MDTTADLQPQPRGDGKVHGEAPRGNERVALGDRTNFENPVLVPGVVDKVAHNGKCALAKKVTKKAIDEDVVVTSSNEEKENSVNRCKPVQGSRKEVKTLTSILTARSKAMACGVTNKPNEQIVDFDETDANDELAVVEYVDELYKFYKLEEDDSRVGD
ncbi:hypothetical protein M0R45_019664 [Rubus argutus]|uniref:Uncharacterized protein n=1 Tax=Rubus argutus TaxID=59490 RepID=A0AAW1X8H9_RUBAR